MSGDKSVSECDENRAHEQTAFSHSTSAETNSYGGIPVTQLSLITLTLLILMSSLAHAKWEKIDTNDDDSMTVYVDPDTTRRKGDLVKMWELFDYKTAQTTGSVSSMSSVQRVEFDCAEETSRLLAFTSFSGNMGRGKVNYTDSTVDKWVQVAPQTIHEALLKFACVKK